MKHILVLAIAAGWIISEMISDAYVSFAALLGG